MPYERLEDLRVYQEAVIIGDEIWDEVTQWKYFEKDVVGKQLADAADSISANIAESYGRTGTKDVVQFLIYARGSMYETTAIHSSNMSLRAFGEAVSSPKQGDCFGNERIAKTY